jgi:hypothetical protein
LLISDDRGKDDDVQRGLYRLMWFLSQSRVDVTIGEKCRSNKETSVTSEISGIE